MQFVINVLKHAKPSVWIRKYIISWFLNVIFQSCFHSSWAENHLLYQMCVVGHILLYSCKVTQFPDFPREFIHFPDILYLKYTSLNSPVSERAPLWRLSVTLQGFDPSATSSMRSELRLMSFWSLWATRAQCMSLDFTQATLAAGGDAHTHIETDREKINI